MHENTQFVYVNRDSCIYIEDQTISTDGVWAALVTCYHSECNMQRGKMLNNVYIRK